MNRIGFLFLLVCFALGARCDNGGTPALNTQTNNRNQNVNGVTPPTSVQPESTAVSAVVVPVHGYATQRTFKAFGEFIDDRFYGYHVGDDVEVDDVNAEVPVYAIADGSVVSAQQAAGYGGVIILEHPIEGETYHALYGHVDFSLVTLAAGDVVAKGDQIAVLGDHESEETDGERKHLHFSIRRGSDSRSDGYVDTEDAVDQWVNPQNFFSAYGITMLPTRSFDPQNDVGGDVFALSFTIPEGMEVEYIPSLEALNIFTLSGQGSARERSQLLIRYFDASQFLTLQTVDVLETTESTVGAGNYTAKQYLIQKKAGVPDFVDQPAWRNTKHTVTDFRGAEGPTRYYVVAANPDLEREIYQRILDSMTLQ